MKKMIRIASVLAIALVAFTGCQYDDAPLTGRVDALEKNFKELQKQVDEINTNILSLQGLVDALNTKDQIEKVEEIEGGYRIVFKKAGAVTIINGKDGKDGTNGQNGTDGHTPIIGVKEEAGQYYWTVDDAFLLDKNGQKIPATAHISTPQIRVNSETDNFEISYNGGKDWEVMGPAGKAPVFKEVQDGEKEVTFVLADGVTTIVIPKAQQFIIDFYSGNSDVIATPGSTAKVIFVVKGYDAETKVDVIAANGAEIKSLRDMKNGRWMVQCNLPSEPAQFKAARLYLLAVKGDGTTAARIVSFEEGVLQVKDENQLNLTAEAGTLELVISTNDELVVNVDPSNGWLKYIETKAVADKKVVLNYEANPNETERQGKFSVNGKNSRMMLNLTVNQAGKVNVPDQPIEESGGTADLETLNGGNQAGYGTHSTTNGWVVNHGGHRSLKGNMRAIFRAEPHQGLGTLTSPKLNGGCGTISFLAARTKVAFTGSGIKVNIKVLDSNSQEVFNRDISNTECGDVQFKEVKLSVDVNYVGDNFTIVVTNLLHSNVETPNDEIWIRDFKWTGYTK